MRIPIPLPVLESGLLLPWFTGSENLSVSRRAAFLLSLGGIVAGLMSLGGWIPGAEALLFQSELFQAPPPSRSLMMLVNGAVLALVARQQFQRARIAAWTATGCIVIALVYTALGHALPVDTWLSAAQLGGVVVTRLPFTGIQWTIALAVPCAALLLTRARMSETHLLVATAMGMTLVGGASLLAIVHAADLATTPTPSLGPVSLLGNTAATAFGISIFLLVSDRQAAPRVPPRWSPEMAAVLSVTCSVALWRALDARLHTAELHTTGLPLLALTLGLAVSGLLYLTLRLLRSNWLQAQRLAHSQLSRAFETASDGVWEYDVRSRLVRRSASQLVHLGYDPALVNATPGAWMSLVHPDDRQAVSSHETNRRTSPEAHGELTYRVRAANGAYHTIIDRGRVVERDSAGTALLIMGISADVTERESVDRERRANERRFRAIFESSLQGQLLLDRSGVCLEVNGMALAVVGARRNDVLGTSLALGPWFTGLSAAQTTVSLAIEQVLCGESVRFEAETHLLDGRIGQLECSLTPLSCEAGIVQQILCELRDVTERRRSEEALREIGALTTMGRLAARVAHEINNPLAGIQNAFLLLGDAVPAEHPHRRFLQSIEREIQRIASVTRSLYETYRQDSPPGAAGSMALAVHDAVSFLDQVNRSRNIRITTDLTRAPALVPVPDALLRQTLYNLVQNAVDASPVGGAVSIVVQAVDDDCVITVPHKGARVPDHMRERIFEPMSGARTAQLRTGSMGIGLSLVRQSVRALGGTVTLLDTPDHGATFEVRLPMTSVVREVSGAIARPVTTPVSTTTVS